MKSICYKGSIMLGIMALSFTACKKEQQDVTGVDFSIEENAQADETFTDSFIDISSFSLENDSRFSANPNNSNGLITLSSDEDAEVTVVAATAGSEWPKIVTFNFKDGKTKNGITRKGKIQAVYSKRFKTTGSTIIVSFIDYYVNNHKIEGTKKITNNGLNPAGNYTFTLLVSGSRIANISASFTYDSKHIIEWTKGVGTATRLDDEFSITGSSSGTSSKGFTYTTTIVKPLIKKVAWPYIVKGSINITAGNLERTLDYGDGALDSKATFTYIGGPVKEIFLRK